LDGVSKVDEQQLLQQFSVCQIIKLYPNRNFHTVPGLVGEGLSHLFPASGLEQLELVEILCFYAIPKSSWYYTDYSLANLSVIKPLPNHP
jgi:hypothetical protein